MTEGIEKYYCIYSMLTKCEEQKKTFFISSVFILWGGPVVQRLGLLPHSKKALGLVPGAFLWGICMFTAWVDDSELPIDV